MRREPRDVSSLALVLFGPLLIVVATSLLQATPAPGFQLGGGTAALRGNVYGQHGQNLTHVRVRLETAEGDLVAEEFSDEQGAYRFGGLQRGVYHLSASTDGYENFRQTVDLTRSAFRTILDVRMTPLSQVSSPVDPPSLTDAQAPRKARNEYQKGMKALAANRIPEAKAHFAKAVDRYPCYARAQCAMALGLISDRNLAGAETALKKAIACDPGYASAYLKLGELYNIQSRFSAGEPVLLEGERREPGSWKFHYQLGITYFGLKAYDKAQDEYLRSEALNPPAPAEVHVKLADVYFKESFFRKAYGEMKAYLHAEPDGRFAPKVKDLIRQMDAYRTAQAAPSSAPATTQSAQP